MPAKWFIDGDTKVLIEDVLSGKVKMDNFPLAYLKEVASRGWDGSLHVTDLYNGARETFLKHTTFYSVHPDKAAFAVAGTLKHAALENEEDDFSELSIEYKGIKGTLDLVEEQPNGELWLVDYKNQGAFAVRKFMGWVKTYVEELDTQGIPVRFKSGKRKGEIKYKSHWVLDPSKADKTQYEYQLNIYRKAIEESLDVKIAKMRIFFILRDGGLAATVNQGLSRNTYYLDVDFLDDEVIDSYIEERSDLKIKINNFLESENTDAKQRFELLKKLTPEMCTNKERWYDKDTGIYKKCENYCDVREICGKLK